jgi:hypothetical protein
MMGFLGLLGETNPTINERRDTLVDHGAPRLDSVLDVGGVMAGTGVEAGRRD